MLVGKSLLFTWFFLFQAADLLKVDIAEEYYHKAATHFRAKRFQLARKDFDKVFSILQKRSFKTPKKQHLLVIGRSDVLYHLIQIDWIEKKNRMACYRSSNLLKALEKLPPDWPKWNVSPLLPKRFGTAKEQFKQCPTIPSTFTVKTVPEGAKVFALRGKEGKWVPVEKKSFPLLTDKVTFRVKAKGYKIKTIKDYKVPRWTEKTLKVELSLLPKPRIVRVRPRPVRKVPKPAVPIYKKPLFWVGIGVGVLALGGGAAAAYVATRPKKQVDVVIIP